MFDLFGKKKDRGDSRAFQYRDEFYVGPAGVRRENSCNEPNAAECWMIAEAFHAAARKWERRAAEMQRHDQNVIDGEFFDTMISGSSD